jgi:tetratricopeptide (TPR) repeat protein
VEEYRKAVEMGPKFADVRTKMAIAYREKGDFDKALEEFKEALKVNSKYIPAYLHLGVTYYMRGLVDHAIRVWKTALKASPDDKSALVYLEFIKDRKQK